MKPILTFFMLLSLGIASADAHIPPPSSSRETSEEQSATRIHIAVKSNMLYDAVLVPNIGVELFFGKNWSIGTNWMYAWWSKNKRHRYWRIYGGDLEFRRWFGSSQPLCGHHAGLYAQMFTYDIEFGNKGYQGPRWSYGYGISYGFSLPVASKVNIDFTVGIGYVGGKYYEYKPIDDHYVWQSTKQRHYFGPSKAEITLVWILGKDKSSKNKISSQK